MEEIYRSIKVPLKKIVKDPDKNLPLIFKTVSNVNLIVTKAYQMIRLFVLTKFESGQDIPDLNATFCYAVLATISNPKVTKRGKNLTLRSELLKFHNEVFLPLLSLEEQEIIPSEGISETLQKISIEMETSYSNNIQTQYLKRLKSLIASNLDPVLPRETKEEKFFFKKAIIHISNGLINQNSELVLDELIPIYHKCLNFVPNHPFEKGSLVYDLEARPFKYLLSFLKINQERKKRGQKLFQPLCLRNSCIPKHIPINIKALIYMFPFKNYKGRTKGELLSQATSNEYLTYSIWMKYFKINSRCFEQKGYRFYNRIDTDGISCNILFIRKGFKGKTRKGLSDEEKATNKKLRDEFIKVRKQKTIKKASELSDSDKEILLKKKMVGLDPGTRTTVQLCDKEGKSLKYTSQQRQYESFGRRSKRTREIIRRTNGILDIEKSLNEVNCKDVDSEVFKNYIQIKSSVNTQVRNHYEQEVYRKMKLRIFINGRRSEDFLLNRIQNKFGLNIVIGYGNWSRREQMKGTSPSMRNGIRRLISKKFETVSVDEYNTSKRCYHCDNELENYRDKMNRKVHRCLVCRKCLSLENGKGAMRHMNRDINGSLNILRCLESVLKGEERPRCLQRSKDSSLDLHNPLPEGTKIVFKEMISPE